MVLTGVDSETEPARLTVRMFPVMPEMLGTQRKVTGDPRKECSRIRCSKVPNLKFNSEHK